MSQANEAVIPLSKSTDRVLGFMISTEASGAGYNQRQGIGLNRTLIGLEKYFLVVPVTQGLGIGRLTICCIWRQILC